MGLIKIWMPDNKVIYKQFLVCGSDSSYIQDMTAGIYTPHGPRFLVNLYDAVDLEPGYLADDRAPLYLMIVGSRSGLWEWLCARALPCEEFEYNQNETHIHIMRQIEEGGCWL